MTDARVLVVDHIDDRRKHLVYLLENQGVTAIQASSCEEGLRILDEVRRQVDVPVLTDVHEPGHCAPAAAAVDVLQIPAFLCRQTDLLIAAGATGKAVNIKKGQFLSPWEMKNVVDKARTTGKAFHAIKKRGNTVAFLDNHAGQDSVFITKA